MHVGKQLTPKGSVTFDFTIVVCVFKSIFKLSTDSKEMNTTTDFTLVAQKLSSNLNYVGKTTILLAIASHMSI